MARLSRRVGAGFHCSMLFTRLVETGQIGTTGISSDLVRQQVFRTFRGQRDLVIPRSTAMSHRRRNGTRGDA
ncbi:hypothetical protein [Streptomyces sp. NPDC001401]|uniref:hypothetical protein n=1 Tax=Streptomyces sp. NPDC001401 TaxID=3364570 RepID=UPI00369D36C9